MLTQTEINDTYKQHVFKGMGSVNQGDVMFLCQMLELVQPQKCLEVGVASGMSTTFLLKGLERISADCELISVDIGEQFYADDSKAVGFVIQDAVPNPQCKFQLHTKHWSADAEKFSTDGKFDFVFIDAHHSHPWATLDTMMVLPFVNSGAWIAHHDIALAKIPEYANETGPVNVYEAFGEPKRISEFENQNIGAFQVSGNHQDYEDVLRHSLDIQWTLGAEIHEGFYARIFNLVQKHYSDDFASYIRTKIEYHNAARKAAVA